MSTQIIGYVSTPFGQKGTTDFDELYKKAIHPAPNVAVAEADIILFREDGSRPPWQVHHEDRIARYRGGHRSHEWQLRQSIQDNIIGSDFLIAVLTDFNPNVMLEVGFAQSQKKIIVYVLYKDQFHKMPANLANLKRLQLYLTPEALWYGGIAPGRSVLEWEFGRVTRRRRAWRPVDGMRIFMNR